MNNLQIAVMGLKHEVAACDEEIEILLERLAAVKVGVNK